MVSQGEIYWLDLPQARGSVQRGRRPVVVVQNDFHNHSPIRSTLVCILTTNLRRGDAPGNVVLDVGEGGTPRPSVVNVSQVFVVDKSELVDVVGSLSAARIRQIADGVRLVIEPRDAPLSRESADG